MRSIRKYDKEFKLNAIKLYQESKKDYKEIAENLEIPSSTLYTWIQEYKINGDKGFQGSGIIKSSNEELHQLKKTISRCCNGDETSPDLHLIMPCKIIRNNACFL